MTEQTIAILRGSLILGAMVLAFGGIVYWTLRRAQDPGRMAVKWVVTLPVLALILVSVLWLGPVGPFVIVFCAIILSLLWTPHLGAAVVSPLTNLFDGGTTPPDPQPFYSIARARQKQGRYAEAIARIREQLHRFPNDAEGQMLLAEIQAEGLRDLLGAEETIERFLEQTGHPPKSICFALYSLADWHLKFGQDRAGAERALRKLQALLPDTEFALGAAQRLAHLEGVADLAAFREKTFPVPEGLRSRGLARGTPTSNPPQETPEAEAARLVEQLEKHPLDTEARENLARLYSDQLGRPDWAIEQLEELIRQPLQPARRTVRWLNLIADVQIRAGESEPAVQATLQRIVDAAPGSAAADQARSRLARLRLEFKGKQASQAVKLGSYEQNIGLRGRSPNQL